MVHITDQKAIQYRLERWGRAFRIWPGDYSDDHAEAMLGSAYGNSILADWVKFGGPPPRGRDCTREDPQDNPIEQQTERAVMMIAKEREAIAWALRARWCGAGRIGVERFELFKALAGDYSKRSYFEFTKLGEAMAFNILFPNAERMRVAA